jgi:hypothetical protein
VLKKLPDNFWFGMLTGLLCLGISYFLIYSLRLVVVNYNGNPYSFAEPRVQLIAILINVILFRFMMVTFQKEKTGRGILFTTVLLTFIYFFLYSRYHFRMSPPKQDTEMEKGVVV